MFNTPEQITVFVDMLERFIQCRINYNKETNTENAANLNNRRRDLENFLTAVCSITPASNNTNTYSCPDCGSDMVLRTNRQNGDKFYGCKKYPNCRGTRDENGLSKAEREEAKYNKEQAEQQGGFSFNRNKRNPVTEVSPPVETSWVNPFAKK